MTHLDVTQFLRGNDACHCAISDLRETGYLHTHNFHELFWVRDGEGIHRINDEQRKLEPGMLILVRDSDGHLLEIPAGGRLKICNLAFPIRHWQTLVARYWKADEQTDWFQRPHVQREFHLGGVEWARLQESAEELGRGSRTTAALDRFLLNLVYNILRELETKRPQLDLPDWLAGAVSAVPHPRYLLGGTAALVDLAGRSPEHVSRTVRKHYGITPTELINNIRLGFAARQLAQTPERIEEIAEACGLANLSHFYRLFKGKFGKSPAEYRRSEQLIVSGRR